MITTAASRVVDFFAIPRNALRSSCLGHPLSSMKQTRTLSIETMTCNNCVRHVTEALNTVEGLQVNSVGIGVAEVTYDPSEVDENSVIKAIDSAGYKSRFAA